MLTIENKNLREYKAFKGISFIFYFMLLFPLLGFIMQGLNTGIKQEHIPFLFWTSIIPLVMLNGMRNMGDTRYYTLQIDKNTVIYKRRKHTLKIPLDRIKKVYHTTTKDISGSTEYLIIFTGWFRKTIFLSDYLMKDNNFDELKNYLSKDRIVNVKSKFLSDIMIAILSLFLY